MEKNRVKEKEQYIIFFGLRARGGGGGGGDNDNFFRLNLPSFLSHFNS